MPFLPPPGNNLVSICDVCLSFGFDFEFRLSSDVGVGMGVGTGIDDSETTWRRRSLLSSSVNRFRFFDELTTTTTVGLGCFVLKGSSSSSASSSSSSQLLSSSSLVRSEYWWLRLSLKGMSFVRGGWGLSDDVFRWSVEVVFESSVVCLVGFAERFLYSR